MCVRAARLCRVAKSPDFIPRGQRSAWVGPALLCLIVLWGLSQVTLPSPGPVRWPLL